MKKICKWLYGTMWNLSWIFSKYDNYGQISILNVFFLKAMMMNLKNYFGN
jgi:hypothetical protein